MTSQDNVKSDGTSEVLPVTEGAEAFVAMLNANGVDCLFLNPGTDTFPVQEAISKFKALGRRTPRVILSLDESVAMAAAHGHFMVSDRPQVILVHADLGALQVGGALHNAQRGRAGVILCAGRTPWTEEGVRGGRSGAIHWLQEQIDQASVVRGYVKWDYELRCNENLPQVIQRAFRIAASEPCGPVYLSLPREVLMEKIEGVVIPAVARHGPPVSPQADQPSLERAAELLVEAQNPLIIAGYSGRHPSSVDSLVALAETLGAPVCAALTRMNFPTHHPLSAGTSPAPYLSKADVILVVDHDVPYVPAQAKPGPQARIIHLDIDPLKDTIPLWSFPADLLIHADSSKALPALVDCVRQRRTADGRRRSQERFANLQKSHQAQRQAWQREAQTQAQRCPITADWLCYCLSQVLAEDSLVLEEAVTNVGYVARHLCRSRPGTLFGTGASSLGWALGAALGARLAAPDRTVVALVGDGSFVFGCPTAALWAAVAHQAPFLTVIFNNQAYAAPRRALRGAYGAESYSERPGLAVGMDISPSPDYALLAQACGAYGERVEQPSEVVPALKRGLQEVKSGKPAVLDIRIAAA